MKLRFIIAIVVLLGLQGCGIRQFTPSEYAVRGGLIPTISINGTTTIRNVQDSKEQAIIYSYAGTQYASNYNALTQAMVDQTKHELLKYGKVTATSSEKTIDLKVTYLLSTYKMYHWSSQLKYTAVLGNGKTLSKTVTHGSASLKQDLNGCIAEAVLDLLKDPTVTSYLSE